VLGRDGWAGLVCLAGSLWLLALTRGLPQPVLVPIGPGFYPRIILVVTAVLAALLLVTDLAARRRRGVVAGDRRNYRRVALTFTLFGGYVLLMPPLGFRLATGLFVLLLQLLLEPAGRRPWLRIGLVTILTPVLTHLVFEYYLSVLLPRGRWTGF
jgi:hypothetical protein